MCLLKLLLLYFCASAVSSSDDDIFMCKNRLECLEHELIRVLERLDQKKVLTIVDNFVSVDKINTTNQATSSKTYNGNGIIERFYHFLVNHEIRIRMPSFLKSRTIQLADEARSRKLKKIIWPLLILLKLKAAVVVPAILSLIAVVAFKGLGISLVALTIAAIVALKLSLEGNRSSKLTYEIIPQIITPSSYWNRAGIESFSPGYHTIS